MSNKNPGTAGSGQEAETRVGLDLIALETSAAATVKTAQWLLGTAGALVPILVAGVQLSRLDHAVDTLLAFAVSAVALASAVGAICLVLVRATHVLKVPYADLSEVLRIRHDHYGEAGWKDDSAKTSWDRAEQAVSAATGGRLNEVPQLHREVQALRASSSEEDKQKLRMTSEVARVVVAYVNRFEIERRFERLKRTYMLAVVVVFGAVVAFVTATSTPTGIMEVTALTPVRLEPSGEWPSALEGCPKGDLVGTAVGGAWPRPDVVVSGPPGCGPAVVGDADDVIFVPLAEDGSDLATSPPDALAVAGPARVHVFPSGSSWPSSRLADCRITRLRGVAVGGTWEDAKVLTKPRRGCPATIVQADGESAVAVPSGTPD